MARLDDALPLARLGVLLGLTEAIAIVRYDIIMDDPRPARVALAVGWALAIIAMNTVAFGTLGLFARARIWVGVTIYTAAVIGTRWSTGDRWETDALWVGLAAIALSFTLQRVPRLIGLVAALAAIPGMWGRVPVYSHPLDERILWLVPGLLIATAIGAALPPKSQRPPARAAATAAAAVTAVLIATLVGTTVFGSRVQAGEATGPNVLFVLVDTLRQDHVAPYGDRATPSTTRLAAEGVAFDEAITVIPKTTQSVAAYQTGKYPIHNGVRVLQDTLAPEHTTLAERFEDAGYRTGAFVHNGWVMRGRGFEQGFQQFFSYFEIERAWGPMRLTGWIVALDTVTVRAIRPFDGNTNAKEATDRVVEWLDANDDDERPFFAYVHYFDPHWPYRPPGYEAENLVNNIREAKWSRGQMMFKNPLPKRDNEEAIALYGHEVDYNADQVGRLLDWLDEAGVADDTIVVFTADHGHHLGDHDYWYHHGEFLYEPGVRIPMLIRYPGHLEAGKRESVQFRNIDLAPTLLALAGLDAPTDIDGLPLSTLRESGAPPAFLETDISYFKMNKRRKVKGSVGKVRGARMGRWKLHYTPRPKRGLWELFDLQTDPEELHDLVRSGQAPPEILMPLMGVVRDGIPAGERAKLEKMGNRFDVAPDGSLAPPTADDEVGAGADDETLDDNERAMLQALGYID